MDSVNDQIRQYINADRIVMFVKGTKEFPQCGFSATVIGIFKLLEVPFQTVNVLADPGIRDGIKSFSNWPTIPQVYLNGEFIGGCDIVRDLYEQGQLKGMAQQALTTDRKLV